MILKRQAGEGDAADAGQRASRTDAFGLPCHDAHRQGRRILRKAQLAQALHEGIGRRRLHRLAVVELHAQGVAGLRVEEQLLLLIVQRDRIRRLLDLEARRKDSSACAGDGQGNVLILPSALERQARIGADRFAADRPRIAFHLHAVVRIRHGAHGAVRIGSQRVVEREAEVRRRFAAGQQSICGGETLFRVGAIDTRIQPVFRIALEAGVNHGVVCLINPGGVT